MRKLWILLSMHSIVRIGCLQFVYVPIPKLRTQLYLGNASLVPWQSRQWRREPVAEIAATASIAPQEKRKKQNTLSILCWTRLKSTEVPTQNPIDLELRLELEQLLRPKRMQRMRMFYISQNADIGLVVLYKGLHRLVHKNSQVMSRARGLSNVPTRYGGKQERSNAKPLEGIPSCSQT